MDVATPKRRVPPQLPIARTTTSGPGQRTSTTPSPTRYSWNITITRFPDPDNKNTMIWGLAVGVSVSVLGISVGLMIYCYYRRSALCVDVCTKIRRERCRGTAAGVIWNPGAMERGDIPIEELGPTNGADEEEELFDAASETH